MVCLLLLFFDLILLLVMVCRYRIHLVAGPFVVSNALQFYEMCFLVSEKEREKK